jgi:hypothetical protein
MCTQYQGDIIFTEKFLRQVVMREGSAEPLRELFRPVATHGSRDDEMVQYPTASSFSYAFRNVVQEAKTLPRLFPHVVACL